MENFESKTGTERELSERLVSSADTLASEKRPERNEDTVLERKDLGLFAGFDGVGGHYGGKEASNIAAAAFERYFELAKSDEKLAAAEPGVWGGVMERAFLAARMELDRFIEKEKLQDKPNTTASVVKVFERGDRVYAVIGNLGDSRVYLLKGDGSIEQITEDDDALASADIFTKEEKAEVRKGLAEAKEEADLDKEVRGIPLRPMFNMRNVISNSLGKFRSAADIHARVLELSPGDEILITSDGVHDNLTESEIREIAAKEDPAGLAKKLVEAASERAKVGRVANIRAKKDDMSAVVFKIGE